MPNFGFARFCAEIDFAVHNEATANAAAERHVKNRVEVSANAVDRFAERGNVCVVVHHNRATGQSTHPAGKIEVGPTLDLMRARDAACAPIDRTTEPDPERFDGSSAEEFGQGRFDLVENSCCAFRGVNGQPFAFEDPAALISKHELEFSAADFDCSE